MGVWGDWKAGIRNLLMLHDDITPPQQFLLQVIREDTPKPQTSLCNNLYVRKDSVQVLLSAERWKQNIEDAIAGSCEITKNGPSVSFIPNWDIVNAFHVRKPRPEIQHWIDMCTGRHWPPAQLLEAARVAPCFLVPSGHPDSDYKRDEWRLSPNLIERMLMFSFNMTQIKCYIVLKLINKSLFTKIVGDSFTSFHCKTVMFYTIARTHPSQWFEHNLMFLLWLCLHVLRKWLRLGNLPHYIIAGMNLFDGKISKVQQRRLLVYIDSMIRNNLHGVFDIGIDQLGCRLQVCSIRRIGQAGELGRVCLRNTISLQLQWECSKILFARLGIVLYQIHSASTMESDIKYVLHNAFECSTDFRLETVAEEFIKYLYLLENSIQSSNRLRLRNVVDSEIIKRVKYSFNTDVASSRLKLASILYCCGHIHATVRVLEDVEKRFHSKVKAACGFRLIKGDRDLNMFTSMLSHNCGNEFSEPPFAFCVKFDRHEAYCAPYVLLFEMNRNITEEEVEERSYIDKQWMDNAEVDARPFLHYLQYLAYGGLGERDNQLRAFGDLESYIGDKRNTINLCHIETTVNLLGHCYEMEGDYIGALYHYEKSLHWCKTNNAANWHARRVLRVIRG